MASYGCGTYALRSVCSSCVATATRCRQLRLVQMVRCCYPAQTMAPHVCMHCAADCGCACLLSAAKACRTAGTFALLLQAAMPECLVWNSCHSCDSIMEQAFVKQICHTPHINMRNFLQQGALSFACVAHTLGANPLQHFLHATSAPWCQQQGSLGTRIEMCPQRLPPTQPLLAPLCIARPGNALLQAPISLPPPLSLLQQPRPTCTGDGSTHTVVQINVSLQQ